MTLSIALTDSVSMPLVGYGTYQTPPGETEGAVAAALRAGYRAVDTAQCYGNEREVGAACRASGLPRSALFITTKLWGCRGYKDTGRSIDGSLARLGLGAVDLLLLHEPTGDVPDIYRAMEDALRAGKARAIGVSNFLEDKYLALLSTCAVPPALNQTETHVFRQQKHLRTLEQAHGTVHASWSPLACGRHGIFRHPVLERIARAHGKSAAQIALRFLVQQHIPVIPKSLSPAHMADNLALFDFSLTADDRAALEALDEGKILFHWW